MHQTEKQGFAVEHKRMFESALEALKAAGGSEKQVANYSKRWAEADQIFSGGAVLPCPYCFLSERTERLRAVEGTADDDRAMCASCGSTLYWAKPSRH
jgi:hypothetical protein